jgi:branched-chain amino acid transport system substrate-binding protein
MDMFRYFFTAAGIVILSFFPVRSAWADAAPPESEATLLTVGAILPLTGNAADQGEWARHGLELAAEELNAAGRYRVRIIFEDSKGDPRAAVSSYTSLRSSASAVFTWGSGVGLALTPLVNRDKVIQIGVATGAPDYRSVGDYTFRTFGSNLLEAAYADSIVDEISANGPIAIVKVQNDYGVGYASELRRLLEKRNRQIVFEDVLGLGETDFRSLILKLKSSGAKAVMLIAYPTEGALFLAQMKQLGLKLPVLAGGAILSTKQFFDLAAGGAEGIKVIVPTSAEIQQSAEMKNFTASYEKRFGGNLNIFNWYAARAYDALMVYAASADNCPDLNPDCLRDNLFKIKNHHGAGGLFSFDEAGDIQTPYSTVQAQGTTFTYP